MLDGSSCFDSVTITNKRKLKNLDLSKNIKTWLDYLLDVQQPHIMSHITLQTDEQDT